MIKEILRCFGLFAACEYRKTCHLYIKGIGCDEQYTKAVSCGHKRNLDNL